MKTLLKAVIGIGVPLLFSASTDWFSAGSYLVGGLSLYCFMMLDNIEINFKNKEQ